MPFRPPSARRERILAFGTAGAGKTRMWLSIAKKYEQLKTPGVFYVLDTDGTMAAMLDGDNFGVLLDRTQFMTYTPSATGKGTWSPRDEVVENPRMVVFDPYDWPEYVDAVNYVKTVETNDDWTIVDMIGPQAWEEVQTFYIDQVFKKTETEFYLAARDKKGGALDGDKDWTNINRMYREFAGPLNRLRGHLFLVTGVKDVETEGMRADKKDVRVLFGGLGVKPAGQKATHHTVHTVILAQEFRTGEWIWTTAKDREREKMLGEEAGDFAMQYLVKRGGWKLA